MVKYSINLLVFTIIMFLPLKNMFVLFYNILKFVLFFQGLPMHVPFSCYGHLLGHRSFTSLCHIDVTHYSISAYGYYGK